ncbi:DUF6134 family protein [Hyphomonas sp. FCG-A18]|uniref:DUF6134 family protein n=1 Tax=Hyphomonas sp. FCG-A18 TaxID=3080019 RepID=UPI002B2F84A0|nr:DUF6134 family protein [Hyphomonas sp. FCG-A18]
MIRYAIAGAVAGLMAGMAFGEADVEAVQTSMPTPFVAYDGAVIDFQVLRKGKPFGRHVLTFDEREDGTLEVTTDVDLDVKFGPITAFKYRLDATEIWESGRLISLDGKSNNDGRRGKVSARADGGQLVVDSTKFDGVLPTSIIPSSHWNILQVMGDRMISTETGEILDIEVERIGEDVVMVNGTEVPATHYRLKSDLTVDLWYDYQNRWVKLIFEARGQEIKYVLQNIY